MTDLKHWIRGSTGGISGAQAGPWYVFAYLSQV